MLKKLLSGLVLVAALAAQTPATDIDAIVKLLQAGLSESLVITTIQAQGQSYQLSPADMLLLQEAGGTEALITAMMTAGSGESGAATASSAAASAPVVESARGTRKRRLAVQPFDYAAVQQWVGYWFGGPTNIGEGIRAMLTARMHQAKNVVLVERSDLSAITEEQILSNTGRINQGTKVRTGQLSAADIMLLGDITIFGRDDTTEKSNTANSVSKVMKRFSFGGAKLQNQVDNLGQMTKEEKAVVAIALRIVDVETGEVLETAEARGESSRKSTNWDQFKVSGGTSSRSSESMTSSNFQATIIGEATSDAVDKVIAWLDEKAPEMPSRLQDVKGRVAQVSGGSPILAMGANDGVMQGDRFEISKIIGEILDPDTKEVLDLNATPVGFLTVTQVRERVSMGSYQGETLAADYEKGYSARLVME